MKPKITFLTLIGMLFFLSCTSNDNNLDSDTIAEVFELNNVSFDYNATDGYTIYNKLTPQLYPSDVILIYRLAGTFNGGTPIWQQIPRTLYVPQGEIDYDFDFSKEDFTIYAAGDYNIATTPQFLNNQTFRIVIVPGAFSKSVNMNDINAVLKALNIDESQIKKIKL